MEIIGVTDDSFDTGTRMFYTVELWDGIFVDVMCIREQKGGSYEYIMQCADGGTVYTSESSGDSIGSTGDFGLVDSDVIHFVLYSIQNGLI